MDAAALQKMGGDYGAFTQSIIQSGNFKAGDALQPTSTATTVRVRDGKTLTTDGPFAETREQLGGYYLVEAKDLDAALEIAARIPGAKVGSIEVRPILVYSLCSQTPSFKRRHSGMRPLGRRPGIQRHIALDSGFAPSGRALRGPVGTPRNDGVK
jgi:hypothetical protein